MKKNIELSRKEKLILVMYEMSKKEKNLKFEDIVVSAFKDFPGDFHLKGYNFYPDSGDVVHKPLYELRKKGLLEANNKIFSFTSRGFDLAKQMHKTVNGISINVGAHRLPRYVENELERVKTTEGFSLFIRGKNEEINETDFYTYLGVTPRTSRNDFLGRLNTMKEVIASIVGDVNNKENMQIVDYDKFLIKEKFKSIVDFFSKN